jgi:predicted transcriptional regulator
MASKELAKIHELLGKLRREADLCLKRINELEQELNGSGKITGILNKIADPVQRRNVARLMKVIKYEPGDSLRIAIKKLENYIIEGEFVDFRTYKIMPNRILADALSIDEGYKISYEEVLGKIPTIFK